MPNLPGDVGRGIITLKAVGGPTGRVQNMAQLLRKLVVRLRADGHHPDFIALGGPLHISGRQQIPDWIGADPRHDKTAKSGLPPVPCAD